MLCKTTTPLHLRINSRRTTVLHQYSNLSVFAHASEHKITKLEDCYNLKGIYKHEEHSYTDFNDANLRIHEICLLLILISKTSDSLNIK